MTCAAGEYGDILQHCLAPVAKAGGLYGYAGEGAAELIDYQSSQRFALDVLRDDEQLCALLNNAARERAECS